MRIFALIGLAFTVLFSQIQANPVHARSTSVQSSFGSKFVGLWKVSTSPYTINGLTISSSNASVSYFKDGTWESSSTTSVRGRQLPQGGGTFRVSSSGWWSAENGQIREKIEAVLVVPLQPGLAHARYAKAMEAQYRASPSFSSDVLELAASRMKLKNRVDGTVSILTRMR